MSGSGNELNYVGGQAKLPAGVQRFSHQAMATTFEVLVEHGDKAYAEQAAWACFDEVDRLEGELSRFVENSDISRLNALGVNECLQMGQEGFECLQKAKQVYEETGGAFDVSVGFLMECWLDEDKGIRRPCEKELAYAREHVGMEFVTLDEENYTAQLSRSPMRIDLGGIGKGYAVDSMAAVLKEWGIGVALIHGGFSTALGIGAPAGMDGWDVTISNPHDRCEILCRLVLNGQALSGSGLEKGRHIINPRTGEPAVGREAAWALADDAARADALSTAFIVMSVEEVRQFCGEHADVKAMVMCDEIFEKLNCKVIL